MAQTSFHIPLSYQNRTFSYFLSQIEQQRRILQNVRKSLPENLAKHACHCLTRNDTLLLYTDSAIWASQLRFYKQAILADIAPLVREPLQKMQVKIMTGTTGGSLSPVRKANIPSPATIEMMQKQSASITDPALKQALLRLNATLKRLADGAG